MASHLARRAAPTYFEQIPVDAVPRPRRHVLIVDADRDTRTMYADYLRLSKYRVEEARDGSEALAKAAMAPPHVVVMEARLPFMGGVELCRIMRRDPLTCGIAVIVLTADLQPRALAAVRAAGPDAILTKPCLPDALEAEIRKVLTGLTG